MKFSESLKKNEDFKKVYKNKRSLANKYFVMYVSENGLSINRLGISVSKKVGNSVVRHRIKRLVKEAFRNSENMFNSGLDIVFVARKNAALMSYSDAQRSLMGLAASHRILQKAGN